MGDWAHSELVERAAHWVRSTMGYGTVVSEPFVQAPQPDVLGLKTDMRSTLLVECKTTRADFRADQGKHIDLLSPKHVGVYRCYFTPPELVEPDEFPDNWGLAECHDSIVRKIVHPEDVWDAGHGFDRNVRHEAEILRHALRQERRGGGDDG